MRGAATGSRPVPSPVTGDGAPRDDVHRGHLRTLAAGLFIGLFFTALLFGAVIGSSGQPPADEAEAWASITRSSGASSTSMTGDGVWEVGVDVAPGTYEAASAAATSCSWSVHAADGTVLDEGRASGAARATLEHGQRFTSSGCGPWARAD
jgi:hypothetical protein